MHELPEALKKYLPASLSLVLGAVWVVAEKPIREFVQEQIKPIPARIRVENKKNDLYVVHVEITRDSDKVFEEVQIGLQLRAKPATLKAELLALDGTHPAVAVVPTNNEGKTFFVDRLTGQNPPMTLRQRESIEISFEEALPDPVSEVWLQSKDRRPIALSDPNQRWPVAKICWRAVAALLGVASLFFMWRLLVPFIFKKAQKQFEEDVDLLHRCGQAEKAALKKFHADFQQLVDEGTAKYLKAFHDDIREPARSTLIPYEIFRRAESLPQLRRPLKGEVQRFVITFCLEMLDREYKTVKAIAKADSSRIG